ncbi:hypothetical protein BDV98DRAFT_600312 [Pterulicium gracile]|uniref:Uncharacterized protein n=1 Tax=Pterulicium gracile TaxID=1884261 RepID=A0A5C3QW54_9AGAR|nr:hypothetical protein BDV98DRAFT_600312 [Pterula gracilis]
MQPDPISPESQKPFFPDVVISGSPHGDDELSPTPELINNHSPARIGPLRRSPHSQRNHLPRQSSPLIQVNVDLPHEGHDSPYSHSASTSVEDERTPNTKGLLDPVNALQLLIASSDSDVPPVQTTKDDSNQVPLVVVDAPKHDSDTTTVQPSPKPPSRPRTIRFHSRVRIASGIHHTSSHSHHQSVADRYWSGDKDDVAQEEPRRSGSDFSSRSGSPSSSISAPLRSRSRTGSEEEGRTFTWAPLGRRIGLLANSRNHARRNVASQETNGNGDTDRTHLLPRTRSRRSYVEGEGVQPGDDNFSDDEFRQDLNPEEVDSVFGKWPTRLTNRHWWWWQFEPVCCCFLTSDHE